ncbi:MAG: hypothetical protein IJV21_02740, partial [Lachnospiraceae bacterium]|nr:hypothetical protein [Lachnospiraceae bacterium]
KINDAVKALNKPSVSIYDLLIKAGHMRMVLEGDTWKLRNTRTKDLEFLKEVGYIPEAIFKA